MGTTIVAVWDAALPGWFIGDASITPRGRAGATAAIPTFSNSSAVQTLGSVTCVVANPVAGAVRVSGGCSCYITTAGTTVAQFLSMDGGSNVEVSRMMINPINAHTFIGMWERLFTGVTPGSHTFSYSIQALANGITADVNDRYSLSAYELP